MAGDDEALDRFNELFSRVIDSVEASKPFFEVFRQHSGMAFIKEYFPRPDRLIMQEVSDQYDRVLLAGKRSLYIGKTDLQYWGYEVGAEFFENDMKIINGIPFEPGKLDEYGRLSEHYVSPTTGVKGVWNGRKYRLNVADRVFLVGLD